MWSTNSWQVYALGSAVFAALTAILGKIGVEKVNSNFATFIRTIVILIVTALILTLRQEWQKPESVPMRSVIFLVLSGIATGLSWLCYYRALQLGDASLVAPVDKLSVVLVILMGVLILGEKLTWQTALGGLLVTGGAVIIAWPKAA